MVILGSWAASCGGVAAVRWAPTAKECDAMTKFLITRPVLAAALLAVGVCGTVHAEPLGRVAARLGLTPRAAAAGGLAPAQASTVITRLGAPGALDSLVSADAQVETLAAQVQTLASQVADQPGNPVFLQQYSAARSSLADARQLLAQRFANLRAQVCEGVPSATLQNVVLCAQRANHRFPTPFAVAPLTPVQRLRAERAIVAERRSQRMGTPMPPEEATFLAQVRARPEVVQAQQALAANLQAMQSTLNP